MKQRLLILLTGLSFICGIAALSYDPSTEYTPKNVGVEMCFMLKIHKSAVLLQKKYHVPYSVIIGGYSLKTNFGKRKKPTIEEWTKQLALSNTLLIVKRAPAEDWRTEDERLQSLIELYNLTTNDEIQ